MNPHPDHHRVDESITRAWFCVRSQLKHEHIAAGHLREITGVDAFLPRVRFRRATKRGAVWTTEALFPNYLFARFEWPAQLRQVQHAHGVSHIIHFGHYWPILPDTLMAELQERFGQNQIHIVHPTLASGDAVKIAGGIFHGLNAVINQIMPSRERVTVLLDFLGQQTCVEVAKEQLVSLNASHEAGD